MCSKTTSKSGETEDAPPRPFFINGELPAIFAVAFACFLASCGKGYVPKTSDEHMVCTQEAMQCSDGSWVGRSGKKCEFVCPQSQPK